MDVYLCDHLLPQLNGDTCNDALVRMADGALRGYRPGCSKAADDLHVVHVTEHRLGRVQRADLAPGDITGDGRADLIARKSSTGDVYLFAATSDAKLKAGVKIRNAWTVQQEPSWVPVTSTVTATAICRPATPRAGLRVSLGIRGDP